MYLEEIKIINYGAIENLTYKFPFNDDGTPNPVVFVGRNGTGKTILLSNIIHSLIEMKRKHFSKMREVTDEEYFRINSKSYIKSGSNYSYMNYTFTTSHFTCLAVNDIHNFKTYEFNQDVHKNIDIYDNYFNDYGFQDSIAVPNKVFDNNIFLYFPVDRYYLPKWLNNNNDKLQFNHYTDNLIGVSDSDMIRDNILENIETWILDVMIDKYLYEPTQIRNVTEGKITVIETIYLGKNTSIHKNINTILAKIFPDNADYDSVRIGISQKRHRKIAIMARKCDKDVELIPTFQHLSSGEVMILAIFCSILKEYDRLSDNSSDISDTKGIVLIDEIDLHLHSDLAKEVLPSLIELFPKIQFIVTSHSPFFLLGMKDVFGYKCRFVVLPTGTIMDNVQNFEEIRKCYDLMDINYKELIRELEQHKSKINALTKPLIITEGKTDWKHIKNALKRFNERNEFINLDIDFLEYEEDIDMSDSKLETLLNNFAKVHNNNKIIGVFDSDSDIGKKHMSKEEYANNVFGICIPNPQNYTHGISIELMYSDADIKLCDDKGRRLFLSDEFTEKRRALKTNNNISTQHNAVKAFYEKGIVKVIDTDVYDESERSIALSKNTFASNVLNRIFPFDSVTVDGFRELFQKLTYIIQK